MGHAINFFGSSSRHYPFSEISLCYRLQPLKPVQVDGPSIEQCAGIIAESHYNPRTMMDPFALRSELLMSSITPQEYQHWQDAAANLTSSSRRTSPILGAKGEGMVAL